MASNERYTIYKDRVANSKVMLEIERSSEVGVEEALEIWGNLYWNTVPNLPIFTVHTVCRQCCSTKYKYLGT